MASKSKSMRTTVSAANGDKNAINRVQEHYGEIRTAITLPNGMMIGVLAEDRGSLTRAYRRAVAVAAKNQAEAIRKLESDTESWFESTDINDFGYRGMGRNDTEFYTNPPYQGNIHFGASGIVRARDEGGESMVTTRKTKTKSADRYGEIFSKFIASEKKKRATEKAKSNLKAISDAGNGVAPTESKRKKPATRKTKPTITDAEPEPTLAELMSRVTIQNHNGGGYVSGSPNVYNSKDKAGNRVKSKPVPLKKESLTEYKLKVKLNTVIEENNFRKKKITEQNKKIKALKLEIETLKKTGIFPIIKPDVNSKSRTADRFSQIDI
jgi:hypothetical protein